MRGKTNTDRSAARWLLLIHQIPPKPDYFRVKIWRRLRNLGAVAIKNSVYALPNTQQSHEDFEWMTREIASGGGESMVCESRIMEGLSDREIVELFQEARDSDYRQISNDAKAISPTLHGQAASAGARNKAATRLIRLKRQLDGAIAIDFFDAPARTAAQRDVAGLEARIRAGRGQSPKPARTSPSRDGSQVRYSRNDYRGRTWVTRKGIHVDRMASAWLIRRFIDEQAHFKFVSPEGYQPQPREVRFDMFDAEFTHEGNRCTFEVICNRFGLADPALKAIAEIIHDIDLKDAKYQRQETAGISRLVAGISMSHKEDEVRLQRGCAVFDDLYECFRRQPEHAGERPERRAKAKN